MTRGNIGWICLAIDGFSKLFGLSPQVRQVNWPKRYNRFRIVRDRTVAQENQPPFENVADHSAIVPRAVEIL